MSFELFKKSSSSKSKRKTEASSSSEGEASDNNDGGFASSASDGEIGAAQSRLKEAKSYLSSLEAQARKKPKNSDHEKDHDSDDELAFGEIDAAEMDREIIASRLQQDTKAARGKVFECLDPGDGKRQEKMSNFSHTYR